MSPTLFKVGPYRIEIRTRDHKPRHFHAVAGKADLKVEIGTWKVVKNKGVSERDAARIIEFAKENEAVLNLIWESIYGEEK